MLIKYLVERKPADSVHWTNGHRLDTAYARGILPQPTSLLWGTSYRCVRLNFFCL